MPMAKRRRSKSRPEVLLETVQKMKRSATGAAWEALHQTEGRLARAAGLVPRKLSLKDFQRREKLREARRQAREKDLAARVLKRRKSKANK